MSKGESFYVWDLQRPVRSNDVIRLSGDHPCFITGESIRETDDAYWTDEFDAWISERGYQMIQNAYSNGELENNKEWEIIFAEWYAKDEAVTGLEEAWHSERMSQLADDAGLYDEQKTNNLCCRTYAWI